MEKRKLTRADVLRWTWSADEFSVPTNAAETWFGAIVINRLLPDGSQETYTEKDFDTVQDFLLAKLIFVMGRDPGEIKSGTLIEDEIDQIIRGEKFADMSSKERVFEKTAVKPTVKKIQVYQFPSPDRAKHLPQSVARLTKREAVAATAGAQ